MTANPTTPSPPQDGFIQLKLNLIIPGEPLPAKVYVHIAGRYVAFRGEGDTIDRQAYERLEMKKIENLFIIEKDLSKFVELKYKLMATRTRPQGPTPQEESFSKFRDDLSREAMDIFHSNNINKVIQSSLQTSKRLVGTIMKDPLASLPISTLQTYSTGTLNHSINVAILSVYLALQIGYSHNVILQNLATGALLHDIGKLKIKLGDDEPPESVAMKMKDHPILGVRFLETKAEAIPKEVLMIVGQHHEHHDGSGYPKSFRGNGIYDLAKIVAIANRFDGLVADASGPLIERQKKALLHLEQVEYSYFDPEKMDKILKVLKFGL